MMQEFRRGLVVVACVSLGFVISAGPSLVARAAEPDRWMGAITADANSILAREEAAQRRVAELEQRVKELEAARGAAPGAEQSPELTAAIARNEQLAALNRELSLENQELAQSHVFGASAAGAGACEPPPDANPRAQLRYWAQQIRDNEDSFGRLSPQWNAAVNVLLRRERELDPHNPWRER